MLLQTIMLLLRERGLDSCPQESWSTFHLSVDQLVDAPPEWMLFCGMAIGHEDTQAAVNRLVSERLALDQVATFIGI
jgi:nitroreductase